MQHENVTTRQPTASIPYNSVSGWSLSLMDHKPEQWKNSVAPCCRPSEEINNKKNIRLISSDDAKNTKILNYKVFLISASFRAGLFWHLFNGDVLRPFKKSRQTTIKNDECFPFYCRAMAHHCSKRFVSQRPINNIKVYTSKTKSKTMTTHDKKRGIVTVCCQATDNIQTRAKSLKVFEVTSFKSFIILRAHDERNEPQVSPLNQICNFPLSYWNSFQEFSLFSFFIPTHQDH